ncbi:MAG: large subunit ribosomal protein [Actinomycetota bacterium]|jgi:large subunit ribosomal protein L22|nr:large subunit ribosomal protein [Actinomycetota bacterium]
MPETATKDTPQTRATLKYLRTSAYKVREVLDLIRGLDVDDARHVLQFNARGPAREVLKVMNSAVANADHTLNIPPDELFVSVAYADEGPTIKRWRPRARGRATRIRKRTCHITIIVARLSDAELQARRRRDSASGTQRRRGVIPGRRRKAADEAAPKAGKGRGKGAEAPQEELPDDASVPEVEPGPPEAGSEAPAEEATAEEATAEEATTEESEEEKAARYASLGREETPAPASEAVTPENGEEE